MPDQQDRAETAGLNCRQPNLVPEILAAFEEAGLKPIEFFGEIALDVGDLHVDDPVATRLQPGPSRGYLKKWMN
jgi:hypothetical protein